MVIKCHKETSTPASPAADSVYFVKKSATTFELMTTSSAAALLTLAPGPASVNTAAIQDGAVSESKLDAAAAAKLNSVGSGGGPSLGTNSIIRTNADTINEDITIPSGTNGMTIGPVTISAGFTVTVDGTWTVV